MRGLFGRGDIDYYRAPGSGTVRVLFDDWSAARGVVAACPDAFPYTVSAAVPTDLATVMCAPGVPASVRSGVVPPISVTLPGGGDWHLAIFRQMIPGAASGNVGGYTVEFAGP